ncbi:hypothetical protein NDU88_002273 [Pleurodeles waltl]|uniref:Uncharacterized protein n=1 Tax=Pleurodeles waltl TaxID=8319 RepID=A0AAV7MM91_PLEWA|nr:hypothetical protein NDU88_002273 [Pleurodeles waltl]
MSNEARWRGKETAPTGSGNLLRSLSLWPSPRVLNGLLANSRTAGRSMLVDQLPCNRSDPRSRNPASKTHRTLIKMEAGGPGHQNCPSALGVVHDPVLQSCGSILRVLDGGRPSDRER